MKEPKDFYYVNENGGVCKYVPSDPDGEDLVYMEYQKEIGNHFETKEEAEKAVEKLKAWKRLKDKGFRFIAEFHRIEEGNDERENIMFIACTMDDDKDFIYGDNKDLKLLFGGEE